MLVALLVILCAILWTSIVTVYFRREIFSWFDNKFGPDMTRPKKPPSGKKPFWRLYG
ncbi:hypothetical protein NFI95_05000 [Acetobacteraceae bacterium KSS8]|uniref:Uncharacterized protein n=1 Tax=Endosaccharibacter trunci TaxID=2812733 RepID=A0ABT1W6L3_9PROT|nr:hypothetical protein [Acetobacteraceae bacterium KSS8]